MSPLDHHVYVCLEEYRLTHESPTASERARIEWLLWQSRERLARRHAAARWLGARLVRLGEGLQGWAEAAARPHSGHVSRPPEPGR
ncbi:MAG TPA: hypothetical protein VKV26_03650 [Dehalococcoidia bacterium]|nr:hypothetical protein [Dehalococcoidia bacterium]